jgi:chemotaxis response regulator CheB
MNADLSLALTHLAKNEILRVHDGRDRGIAVFGGSVWVTQTSDPRDHVLSAGQTFAFDRPAGAIVQALSSASVLVFEVDPLHRRETRSRRSVPDVQRSSLEWHLEARRQRALAIGDAIAGGVAALRKLLSRGLGRAEPVAAGMGPGTRGQ